MHDYRTSGVGRHRPAHRVPARPKCDVSEPWLLRSLPPRAVFERYQQWQLERQPVVFLARRLEDLLAGARAALGAYVDSDPDELVFVPNATAGVNVAARALALEAGDEVLATSCTRSPAGGERR